MPHGTPDWGFVGPKFTTYGLDDLGEHAVRVGSHHLWDRRGDVVVQDSFEGGLGQGWKTLRGLNAAIELWGGHAWHGAYSARLITGSDAERYANQGYAHGFPVSSGLGLEFTFTIPETVPLPEPTTAYWIWYIYQRTALQETQGQVRYDLRDWTLEYLNDAGGWTEFAPLETGIDLENRAAVVVWHTGKLVIDYLLGEYRRFILNQYTWDLSGIPLRPTGVGGSPYVSWSARLEGQDGENQSGYLDAIVCTQNEP